MRMTVNLDSLPNGIAAPLLIFNQYYPVLDTMDIILDTKKQPPYTPRHKNQCLINQWDQMRRFLVGVAISLMALPVFFAPALAAEPVQQAAKKIYCAGPLFTAKEKEEMGQIARLLEKSGFRVFLPHRDGIQLASLLDSFIANGVPRPKAVEILNKAIFYLDVFQVLDSDGLMLNMNGRVPDEGAMVEAGIAWQAGKTIVIYKDDARSLVDGNDNPLIMGLTGFKKLRDINEIPQVFKTHFAAGLPEKCADSGSKALVAKGWQILEIVSSQKGAAEVARAIMLVLDE